MKFKVTMCAIDIAATFATDDVKVISNNGKTLHSIIIDTEKEEIFHGIAKPWEIMEMTESFHNRLNEFEENNLGNCTHPDRRVVVLNVSKEE